MRSQLLRLLALLSLSMLPTAALAVTNVKAYPGNECKQDGTAGIYGTAWGSIVNTSSSGDMSVICPLVKDDSSLASAVVRVFDRNTTLNVSCDLRTEYVSGSSFFISDENEASSGYGSNAQDITFSSPPAGGDYYYFYCGIPRSSSGNLSSIVNIWVTENV